MDRHHKQAFLQRWAPELSARLERTVAQLCDEGLLANDFSGSVTLDFEDGSRVAFRYAFAVHRLEAPDQVAIFTEHCGYHEFEVGPDDVLTQH